MLQSRYTFDRLRLQVLFFTSSGSSSYKNSRSLLSDSMLLSPPREIGPEVCALSNEQGMVLGPNYVFALAICQTVADSSGCPPLAGQTQGLSGRSWRTRWRWEASDKIKIKTKTILARPEVVRHGVGHGGRSSFGVCFESCGMLGELLAQEEQVSVEFLLAV